MLKALNKDIVKTVYDKTSRYYDRYHSLATFNSDEVGRQLVVKHGVKEGDTVLDAGGGTGSTSFLAAKKAGRQGKVILLDLSDGMLEIAKKKAEKLHLAETMSYQTGDILNLPFDDNEFDAVLSTYSTCPLYDPVEGALELYRVVKPGGRLAVAHSVEPQNPLIRWLAHGLEKIIWLFPRLSLGCRPVTILPSLIDKGAKLIFEKRIGLPHFPFQVFVVQKPK